MAQHGRIAASSAFLAAAAAALVLPDWIISLATIAFANGLVVLGLIVLWRAGLVSFGQALYYCIGAYAVALVGRWTGVTDACSIGTDRRCLGRAGLLRGGLPAGALPRNLLRDAQPGTVHDPLRGAGKDRVARFDRRLQRGRADLFGYAPHQDELLVALYWLVLAVCAIAAFLVDAYFRSLAGALAIPVRDNEIRVEFLGMSVSRLIHTKLVISGLLGGMGGALAALAVGHVDPNMSYWTTSGEFVFITILAGAGSVGPAFVGSLVFESVRSFAFAVLPQLWQMLLGSVLLLTILFLPQGLGSLITRLRWRRKAEAP